MIKLGFVKYYKYYNEDNSKAIKYLRNEHKDNVLINKRMLEMKRNSKSINKSTTNKDDNFKSEALLCSRIWNHLNGNVKGYISIRNLKLYLSAI